MNAITTQVINKNFLSPTGFKFDIPQLPTFSYFVQTVQIPSLELNSTSAYQTPFGKITTPGDHVTFSDLSVTFKIDEDMLSYFEIYDWITDVGLLDSFSGYQTLASNAPGSKQAIITNAVLTVLNSAMQPNVIITFRDLIPSSLTINEFNTTDTEISYLTGTVVFKYREFTRQYISGNQ